MLVHVWGGGEAGLTGPEPGPVLFAGCAPAPFPWPDSSGFGLSPEASLGDAGMALCAPEAIVVGSVILVVALMRSCVGAFMR